MRTRAQRRAAERRGRIAEALCVLRLVLTGWRILAWRRTARRGTGLGEIDIIARRGETVAFIEVKARRDHAAALEAVGPRQRARIARSAAAFLAGRTDLTACTIRFDVMVFAGGLFPRHMADAWRL
jgi:putative endonuclease